MVYIHPTQAPSHLCVDPDRRQTDSQRAASRPPCKSILIRSAMVLQDKYKRATSSRYRATHGGIQSNRQKAKAAESTTNARLLPSAEPRERSSTTPASEDFPALCKEPSSSASSACPPDADLPDPHPPPTTQANPFARRGLASNADRYLEPEPDPNEEPEPEIDLTGFITKQKARIAALESQESGPGQAGAGAEDDDVDTSFDALFQHSQRPTGKPAKVFIADPDTLGLAELDNERRKADASRELIARFSATQLGPKPSRPLARNSRTPAHSKQPPTSKSNTPGANQNELVLPLDDQDFLDEVLNDSSGTYGKFKPA